MYPISKVPAYDKVPTMFSPDGRLYQVEYASKIVEQGTTGAAIVFKGGVLLGADKMIKSKLVLPKSVEKIFKVDENIGVVSAGLVGDARRLVGIARKQAQENRMVFSEKIQVEMMAKEIAETKQAFTQYGGLRPFGVSFIVGGIDESGARLFETETSGAMAEYNAVALGRNKEKAMKVFEKGYKEGLAFEKALSVLYKALEKSLPEREKASLNRLEFALIDSEGFRLLDNQKIKNLLR